MFRLMRRIHISPAYLLVPVVLSLAAAACEGVSVGLLIPLLQGFLTKDFSFVQQAPVLGPVIRYLSTYTGVADKSLFGLLLGIFVGAVVLKNLLRFAAFTGMDYVAMRSLHHLRKTLFARYLSFGKLFFDRTPIGRHSITITDFANGSLRPVFAMDKYVNLLFSIISYLVIMSMISWKLTLFALPLFAILHFCVQLFIDRIRRYSRALSEKATALNKKVIEILSTIPLVKASNTEDSEQRHFGIISDERARLEFRSNNLQHLVPPLQELITLIAVLILFSGMLYLMVHEQTVTAPAFIVYFYLVLNAASKFGTFTGLRTALAVSVGPLEEVLRVFDDADKNLIPDGTRPFTGLKRCIEFRDLRFSYAPGKEVLRGVSFTVPHGSVTAIVGSTGAGKSTLINLLLRFYDCPSGSLFVDDIDVREYRTADLRRHMALVSQETLLLHESLRSNIAYGLPDATDEQIMEAARRARLADFIRGLPKGLDTLIGDRGVQLSGGEKQRVSIARALLKGAEILILDEATSALDSTTEQLIQEAIDDAIRDRTAIVIAHRLSTIRNADHIVVIEEGRVIEQGTLEELIGLKGAFHRFWEQQKFA
ncbi:MAG: ABC transporter [Candidatus Peregrinibacteria bacterium Greene0416_19]|nr:MAG: ABC transporter [Candidatus Peregrinibacteria bacterium Greene0416_19]